MPQHPASFRDPAGQVHLRDGRVFRSVLPAGSANYQAAKSSGFLAQATAAGRLIAAQEVEPSVLASEAPNAVHVLEHPQLDFISFPYEWPFDALRDAALLTLDLHLEALGHDLTLSDASAFNVQFIGPKPIFIDYLSLIKYQPGQVWLGYRQFCEQFLNPLLLTSTTGVAYQPFYRGTLEGIRSADLAALLPIRAKWSPRIALHVMLQARMQRTVTASATAKARRVTISKAALAANLSSLRGWIAKLAPPKSQATPWQFYEQTVSYSAEERARKTALVGEFVRTSAPKVVWDIGCNSGEYSEVALKHGAGLVVGFEPDQGALNAAFRRAGEKALAFLPLSLDVTNPSPSLGWREQERPGLMGRRNADLVMALAIVHHLILGRNIPLDQVVEWLTSLAPRGLIEFVPKEDPMASQILALKPDIAPDYDAANFEAALARRATIVRRDQVSATGRILFAFSR
jgi:ribosomal protein L11 methylase PrmA